MTIHVPLPIGPSPLERECMAEGCAERVTNAAICSLHGIVVSNHGPIRTAPMGSTRP